MSLAVIVPYQLLTPPSPPPPTPVLGVTSLEPVTIDFELLEEILLFGDLTKGPKPGKIHTKLTKNTIDPSFLNTNFFKFLKQSAMMGYQIQAQ